MDIFVSNSDCIRWRMASLAGVLALCAFAGITTQQALAVGRWVPLANKPPKPANFLGIGVKLLLPDGTVMAQVCTNSVSCGTQWVRLAPDSHGSYVNGTWST